LRDRTAFSVLTTSTAPSAVAGVRLSVALRVPMAVHRGARDDFRCFHPDLLKWCSCALIDHGDATKGNQIASAVKLASKTGDVSMRPIFMYCPQPMR